MPASRIRQSSTGKPKKINKREARVLEYGAVNREIVEYNFASDGGAIGTVSFKTKLPANAVVTSIVADEISALTSGGSATVQLQAGSANLTAALAFDTGLAPGVQVIALAATAKTSVESELQLAIATATLTAGRVRFIVSYVVLD